MATNITLKTFKGGNVTPQDDAIIYQTVLPGAGVFKGCEVSFARSNILHISQGFGMIKGRFFEMYETEIAVQLADTGSTLLGRVYIHMDLSNADDPVQVLTETAGTLSTLASDVNVNYNNTTYDLELAKFKVSSTEITDLVNTYSSISAGGSGGGGATGLERETRYDVGDTTVTPSAPGWCTLYCTQAGVTDSFEPNGYSQITKVGDSVLDGTAVFVARNTLAELTKAQNDLQGLADKHDEDVESLQELISQTAEQVASQMSSTGNLVQKIMSISDYNALSTKDNNTMYYCYDNADTHEIKRIYLGAHVIYATGVTVTYKVDSNSQIQQTGALSEDIVRSAPTVTKAGYTFVGWKSDNTADGSVLSSYVLQSASAVTLYAVFKRTITIDMDSMDADLPDGAEETSVDAILYYNNGQSKSENVLIPSCPYVMEDKTFCGWTIDPGTAESYMPGEYYTFTDDATLYPCFVDTDKEFDDVFTSYTNFRAPASGIYEIECWGAEGGTAKGTIDGVEYEGKGGKGGHAKVYRKIKKGTLLYIYNGFHPDGVSASYNRGGAGYSYTSSKHLGAAGGGCTFVSTSSWNLNNSTATQQNYTSYKDTIFVVAGGGGGGGVSASSSNNSATTMPKQRFEKGAHNGGYAGGEKGQDGTSGSLGGGQVSNTSYDYSGWGTIASTGSNVTYSGGGAGWYGGDFGQYGNAGAGGSSYVKNSPTFTFNGVKYKTVNEANNHEGHGRTHIKFIVPCTVA